MQSLGLDKSTGPGPADGAKPTRLVARLDPGRRHARTGWAGWQTPGAVRPLFVIGRPYDGQAHQPGNGQMVAFSAPDRATVDEVHRVALAQGGTSEGAPGLRLEYHANYYGAYVRDPDGNKLCVACHSGIEGPAPA